MSEYLIAMLYSWGPVFVVIGTILALAIKSRKMQKNYMTQLLTTNEKILTQQTRIADALEEIQRNIVKT